MAHWSINTEVTTRQLQDMVRIDSTNPFLKPGGAGESEVAVWLAETCRMMGLDVELQETANGASGGSEPSRPNVLARWQGTGGGKSLLLTGHTDIVSTENMEGDPLDGRIENGRLYGRGTVDMKGGLASILGAVGALKASGYRPRGDVWLGFVTDEEYSSLGTTAMVKAIKPDAAILTEQTDLDICIGHKGFAWVTVETKGFAAHGSLYNRGVDAIAHMGRLLNALERMERDILPRKTHPLLGRASVHASYIEGGLGPSTYPDHCKLQVEHRLLPDETPQDVDALWGEAIKAIKAEDAGFSATAQVEFSQPGYEIDRDADVVRTLHQAYASVRGSEPEYMGMWAWLDAVIMGRAGIPTVVFGPGGEGAHGAVEYVILDEVFTCAAVLAEATAQWTG